MLTKAKQWCAAYGDIGISTLLGFIAGLTIASHVPQQALLMDDIIDRGRPVSVARSQQRTTAETASRSRPSHRVVFWINGSRRASTPASPSSSSRSSSARLTTKTHDTRPVFRQSAPVVTAATPARTAVVPAATAPIKGATAPPVVPAPVAERTTERKTVSAEFPAFGKTVYPVSQVPNWGAMHGAAEWDRPYKEMTKEDLVPLPSYDLAKLNVPFQDLVEERNETEVTRKLFYSTKFLGKYDLDAGEYTGTHPGVDLKLALGTPIGAIAGGRVVDVREDAILGLHVMIEHHAGDVVYYSIYGHFGAVAVKEGATVQPGQFIGTVGTTGNTTGPHLHLQVDRGHGEIVHVPYEPAKGTPVAEAQKWTVNPITFIRQYATGV